MPRLIDADAFKKKFCDRCNDILGNEPCFDTDCFFHDLLNEIPTIEAEPVRHGEWEPVLDSVRNLPTPVLSGWRCSECGRRIDIHKEPYCNCGAKMRGKEKEE